MAGTKKAGLLTKIVVLALLIYLATTLLELQGQIKATRAQRDALNQQVEDLSRRNQQLSDAVDNSDDPLRMQEAARDRLGLVEPGEKVFVFTN